MKPIDFSSALDKLYEETKSIPFTSISTSSVHKNDVQLRAYLLGAYKYKKALRRLGN